MPRIGGKYNNSYVNENESIFSESLSTQDRRVLPIEAHAPVRGNELQRFTAYMHTLI